MVLGLMKRGLVSVIAIEKTYSNLGANGWSLVIWPPTAGFVLKPAAPRSPSSGSSGDARHDNREFHGVAGSGCPTRSGCPVASESGSGIGFAAAMPGGRTGAPGFLLRSSPENV